MDLAELDAKCPRTVGLDNLNYADRFCRDICARVVAALAGLLKHQGPRKLLFSYLDSVQPNLSFSLLPEGVPKSEIDTRSNDGFDAPLTRSQRSVLCLMCPNVFPAFVASESFKTMVQEHCDGDAKEAVGAVISVKDDFERLLNGSSTSWLQLFGSAAADSDETFAITDPNLEDNPLVYVNDAFVRETGYEREEILGRSCRFLQGEGTEESAHTVIREALDRKEGVKTRILNYRKNGEPYWNLLHIVPVWEHRAEDSERAGRLAFFVSVQFDLGKTRTPLEIFQLQTVLDLIPGVASAGA